MTRILAALAILIAYTRRERPAPTQPQPPEGDDGILWESGLPWASSTSASSWG